MFLLHRCCNAALYLQILTLTARNARWLSLLALSACCLGLQHTILALCFYFLLRFSFSSSFFLVLFLFLFFFSYFISTFDFIYTFVANLLLPHSCCKWKWVQNMKYLEKWSTNKDTPQQQRKRHNQTQDLAGSALLLWNLPRCWCCAQLAHIVLQKLVANANGRKIGMEISRCTSDCSKACVAAFGSALSRTWGKCKAPRPPSSQQPIVSGK